jgi:hypothetical protein
MPDRDPPLETTWVIPTARRSGCIARIDVGPEPETVTVTDQTATQEPLPTVTAWVIPTAKKSGCVATVTVEK